MAVIMLPGMRPRNNLRSGSRLVYVLVNCPECDKFRFRVHIEKTNFT